VSTADFGCCKNRSQVLAQESGILAAGSNIRDAEWYSRRQRKAEGGPKDLTSPFTE
jgi:hypothetical protein